MIHLGGSQVYTVADLKDFLAAGAPCTVKPKAFMAACFPTIMAKPHRQARLTLVAPLSALLCA